MSVKDAKENMTGFYASVIALFLTLTYFGYHYADNTKVKKEQTDAATFSSDMAYYDLPRINLDLGQGSGAAKMRIDLSLEVAKRDMSKIKSYQPRIIDRLNSFLFNIDPPRNMADVQVVTEFRRNILDQVNKTGMPIPVHDVLLRQLLIM